MPPDEEPLLDEELLEEASPDEELLEPPLEEEEPLDEADPLEDDELLELLEAAPLDVDDELDEEGPASPSSDEQAANESENNATGAR